MAQGEGTSVVGDVEKLLLRIGRKQQEFDAIQGELDAKVAALRKDYGERLKARAATLGTLEGDLQQLCERERGRLFGREEKSTKILFGWVGWRKGRDSVRCVEGQSQDEAADALATRGYESLVSVKRSVRRSEVLAALKQGRISQQVIEEAGLEFVEGEDAWFYKVDASAVRQYLSEHGEVAEG